MSFSDTFAIASAAAQAAPDSSLVEATTERVMSVFAALEGLDPNGASSWAGHSLVTAGFPVMICGTLAQGSFTRC